MYCKCGCLRYARKVFDETPERDVVFRTNMISGYSNLGRVQESRVLFERMGLEGVKGNEFTWNALIAGYARVGDCDEAFKMVKGVELFREMLVAGVKPNPVTIMCLLHALVSALLDMYSSCGYVKLARNIFDNISSKNVVSWNAMIGYLAKKVAAALMKMKTNKPGGFVTLYNIYAAEGEWAKVEILREVMKVQEKLPGFSSLPNDL
ncbi:pentatricopeptide repeat-containing protein [Tanacetum coccineum]